MLPDRLIPCLSNSAVIVLSESIRVSNAESQLALPLAIKTFLASSVVGSPKESAVWTVADGAGVCSADGEGDAAGAGEGLAAGAGAADGAGDGAGLAETSGAGVGEGCCAFAAPPASEIASGINRTGAQRQKRGRFIYFLRGRYFFSMADQIGGVPVEGRLTRNARLRHMTDGVSGGGDRT